MPCGIEGSWMKPSGRTARPSPWESRSGRAAGNNLLATPCVDEGGFLTRAIAAYRRAIALQSGLAEELHYNLGQRPAGSGAV